MLKSIRQTGSKIVEGRISTWKEQIIIHKPNKHNTQILQKYVLLSLILEWRMFL